MCNENIPSSVLNRLIKEVKEYTKAPVSDIKLQINEENFTDLRAEISGPAETPFHGGCFKMKLVFGPDFPSAPPKGYFITPIFHPNWGGMRKYAEEGLAWIAVKLTRSNLNKQQKVAKNGEICVNTLKKDWKAAIEAADFSEFVPDCKLSHILMVVRCLLIEPNPESALNEEAGRMFMEDYDSYAQRARLMTSIHATPEPEAGSSSSDNNTDTTTASSSNTASASASKSLKEEGGVGDKKKPAADKKRSLKRL